MFVLEPKTEVGWLTGGTLHINLQVCFFFGFVLVCFFYF